MYEHSYNYVKAKYAEKSKIVLYGYRQFHCLHKNKRYLFARDVETKFNAS